MVRLQVGVKVLGGTDSPDTLTRLDLAPEARPEGRVISQLGANEFEGNPSTGGVFGEVDDSHPARANTAEYSIWAGYLRIIPSEGLHTEPMLRLSTGPPVEGVRPLCPIR